MSEPFLVLHRVRGKPAFDIAERMCSGEPPCQPNCGGWNGETCAMKDWWIIPTSGHRAYPWFYKSLTDWHIASATDFTVTMADAPRIESMPIDWPDHYSANDRLHINYNLEPETIMTPTLYDPDPSSPSLAQRLGLVKKAPIINRRL